MVKKRGNWFAWRRRLSMICLLFWIMSIAVSVHAQTNEAAAEGRKVVYVVPVEQTIESGLEQFLRRSFAEAAGAGADYIVLEINTLGGAIDAALDIGDLIKNSSIPVVAYIKGRAISAGSYIALNADQIVMHPGATIGAAAVVDISGTPVEDSKVIATWAGEMTAAAELHGRNPDYAKGMVNQQLTIEVPEIGKVFEKGELIAFSAAEAVKTGYAEATARNLNELLAYLNMESAEVIISELSVAEQIARFLTNPYVTVILFIVGLAGIGLEIFAPGFGLPGIIGVSSFVLYFFGNYVAGFAQVEHLLLFVAGIVLMLIEIFMPSFGIFGIIGILCLIAGVVLAAYNTGNALASLGTAFLVTIIVLAVASRYMKRRGVWSKFVLKDQLTSDQGYNSAVERKDLIGKTGIALTPLRPSGTVQIDGERIDVVSAGEFIAKDQKVVVHEVEGTRIVVRKAE